MNRRTDEDGEDYASMRNGKVSWWMMGLIAIVIGICLTGWLNWVYGLSETVGENSQRITRLEECSSYIKQSLGEINHKVDRLIEVEHGKVQA